MFAGLGDDQGDLGEAARDIGHRDAQPHQAPVAHQPAHQHRRQQARVDVAAADRDADALARETARMLEQGGEACGTRALGDGFLDFDQGGDRAFYCFFIY